MRGHSMQEKYGADDLGIPARSRYECLGSPHRTIIVIESGWRTFFSADCIIGSFEDVEL